MTDSWRRRPWAILAVIAIFGLGLLGGDFLRGGAIFRRLDHWWTYRHHQPVYEAWERHVESVNENAPADLVARLKIVEESLLLPGQMKPAGVDALHLMRDLRKQLGMIGRKDAGRWLAFEFDTAAERFIAPPGLAFEDLPENARATMDLLGSWHEENPDRVWGNPQEDWGLSLRYTNVLDDKYQRALAEVVPMDHPYWRAMVRLDLEVHEWDPLPFWPGAERCLRERLLDPTFAGVPLFRRFAPREEALRTALYEQVNFAFWMYQRGMPEWQDGPMDPPTFSPPLVDPDVLESLVLATESVGVGRGHRGGWASAAAGIFDGMTLPTRGLNWAAMGVVDTSIQAEILSELHRWARGEKSAGDLKLTWSDDERKALFDVIGVSVDD